MSRRLGAALLLLGLLAGGCGTGSRGATRDERSILAALRRLDRESNAFTYREEIEGQTVVVRGEVEDDLRYAGTVSINDNEVYRHVVNDDAAALNLIRPDVAGGILKAVEAIDDVSGQDLTARKWVVDPSGAPGLAGPAGANRARQVGTNPLLDAIDMSAYTEQAVGDAAAVQRWNPEEIDYNPLDDPWRTDEIASLTRRGVRRFDIVQPPLPIGGQAGRTVLPPSPRHFRKMAFYLRGDRIVEIREQISFTDRREYRRAKEGRAPKAVIETIDAAREGFTESPVRERRLVFSVEYRDVTAVIPADAEPGSLGAALEAAGIGTLFKAPPRGRMTTGGPASTESPLPESPSPEEGASPGATPTAAPEGSPGAS